MIAKAKRNVRVLMEIGNQFRFCNFIEGNEYECTKNEVWGNMILIDEHKYIYGVCMDVFNENFLLLK